MFEYLECLVDGLKLLGGDKIKIPEKRRFDPEESCMFCNFMINNILLSERKTKNDERSK